MNDETTTDCVVERNGKAVRASFNSRVPLKLVHKVMGFALASFGRDGRVKVSPKVSPTSGRAFFVIASTEDPMGLRERVDAIAAEQLSTDPEL